MSDDQIDGSSLFDGTVRGPLRDVPVSGRNVGPFWLVNHKPPPDEAQLRVTAGALWGWAGKAATAADRVTSSGREIHRAAGHLDNPGKGLETSGAAADFATMYHEWMGHMAEAVRGYGTKLTDAAAAYDNHNIAAGNLFGPQRQTPMVNPGGGAVAD